MKVNLLSTFTTTDLIEPLEAFKNNNEVKEILDINYTFTDLNFNQLIEKVKNNEIDGFYSAINYASPNLFPDYINIFSNIPFEFELRNFFDYLTNTREEKNGLFYLNQILTDFNIFCLPIGFIPAQATGWSNKPIEQYKYFKKYNPSTNCCCTHRKEIKNPFKGLKLRTFGTNIQVFKKLGAFPIEARAEDICKLQQEGKITFAEFATPQSDYELGLYNCFSYYYPTGCLEPCDALYIFGNRDKIFSLLSIQQQQTLLKNAYFTAENVNLLQNSEQIKFLELIIKKGIKVSQLPENGVRALYNAWNSVKKDFANIDETGKEIIDGLNEYIIKYLTWFKLSQNYLKLDFIN
jgi:TRAP-type mannitol/chloroaromatic compound transport system substrate-binding protein